jgi:hypothetical protein
MRASAFKGEANANGMNDVGLPHVGRILSSLG